MVLLKAKNPNLGNFERTFVKAAVSAGGTSVDVDNTNGFSANDYVVIGSEGSELREMVQITAITDDDTLAVGATNFAHGVDEPVTKTPYNKVVFKSGSSSSGDFFDRSTDDIDWDNKENFTILNYPTGSVSDWYKYSFKNTTTNTESASSLAVQVPSYYCTISDVEDYLGTDITQNSEIAFKDALKALRFATTEVNNLTNSSFKSNSITTANWEYHDGNDSSDNVYFTEHAPLISVSQLDITQSSSGVGPSDATWTTLVEGDDFTVDKDEGRIVIIDESKFPEKRNDGVRIAYSWGYSTIPESIRFLATLLAARNLVRGGKLKSAAVGRELTTILADVNEQVEAVVSKYRVKSFRQT